MRLPSTLMALALSGCALPGTQPVTLSEALTTIEADLQNASPIILSDLDTDREPDIMASLLLAQCRTPSLVPVVTGPVSLALQGSVQLQVNRTISKAPSLAFVVTRSNQQQVTFQVMFVSLRGLPELYMNQRLINVANLSATPSDQTASSELINTTKKELVADILAKRKKLMEMVETAAKQFNKAECPRELQPWPYIITRQKPPDKFTG